MDKQEIVFRMRCLGQVSAGSPCRSCSRRCSCDNTPAQCNMFKMGTPFVPKPIRALIAASKEWFSDAECECWKGEFVCRQCAIRDVCRELDDWLRLANGFVECVKE